MLVENVNYALSASAFLPKVKVKVKVPILVYVECKGPELIPDSRQFRGLLVDSYLKKTNFYSLNGISVFQRGLLKNRRESTDALGAFSVKWTSAIM